MSLLAYNPGDYDIDLRYLKGLHKQDVINYKKARFPSNSDEIRVMMQNIVQGYISNMSNIYSAGVEYVGIDLEKYSKMLRRKARSMKEMEQFYNYQKMSILWTYLVNGEVNFMALDGSSFYIDYDIKGNINAVIVRTGRFLDDLGETQYHFKMWNNKKVYSKIEKEWGLISINSDWAEDDINPNYEVLPFTIIQNRFVVKPESSTLIDLENEAVSGDAFATMAMLYSLIVKLMISTDNQGPAIQSLMKELGVMNKGAILGENDQLTTMPQVSTDNHMNYKEYVQKILMFVGQVDGVDKQALFPDTKVESGVSRRLQMGMIDQKRNDKILDWEEFEDKHWELINSLDNSIPIPENYIFSPLPNMIDPTEQVDIDAKKWATTQSKYDGGVYSVKEYIKKGNPEADEKEVMERINELSGKSVLENNSRFERSNDQDDTNN